VNDKGLHFENMNRYLSLGLPGETATQERSGRIRRYLVLTNIRRDINEQKNESSLIFSVVSDADFPLKLCPLIRISSSSAFEGERKELLAQSR
jgi:hypothetical protein